MDWFTSRVILEDKCLTTLRMQIFKKYLIVEMDDTILMKIVMVLCYGIGMFLVRNSKHSVHLSRLLELSKK